MKNTKPTRKAFIIGCPGSRGNFLPGVKVDVENMSRFLQSEKGGQWYPNEIVRLYNASWQQAFLLIHLSSADYTLVYFSGHGFTSEDNIGMLAFQDQTVRETKLLDQSPRQLIVIDACRNYVGSGLSGFPDFGDHVNHFEAPLAAREAFDEAILKSPKGKKIVHATQRGQFSRDSVDGGHFTQALLQASTNICSDQWYAPQTIEQVVSTSRSVLKKNGSTQVPCIAFSNGTLSVPFSLTVPGFSEVPMRSRQIVKQNISDEVFAGFAIASALLLLGLVLVD